LAIDQNPAPFLPPLCLPRAGPVLYPLPTNHSLAYESLSNLGEGQGEGSAAAARQELDGGSVND